MKSFRNSNPSRGQSQVRFVPGSLAACIVLAATGSLQAAEITLKAGGDAAGANSFATGLNWSNSLAPSTGNTYVVGVQFLRTPPDGASYTFGGDSLALNTGGAIIYKGTGATGILTIGNLILNGGYIRSGSSYVDVMHIAGGMTVNGTGSYLLADQSAFIFDSIITGTGALSIQSAGGGYPITFNGASTYTGTLTVSTTQTAAATTLSGTSRWKFAIGASGVNNSITGAGKINFNGAFDIDLSGAGNTIGNTWNLVNVATLVETYGTTFTIAGFTKNGTLWTSANGNYQFNQATGVLTRISPDTDLDGLPDAWEIAHFGDLSQGAQDGTDANNNFVDGDYDDDLASNLDEYLANTDPTDPNSWPDTDNDGLNDGWEKYHFTGSLAYTGADDPDNDFNTNAAEFAAGTNPNYVGSFPDTDNNGAGDGLNDGWEIRYFGSTSNPNAVPGADPDGDLFTNFEEQAALTNPIDQVSSPETDGDYLTDGWEVKYFRVGQEDLATVLARYGAGDDPDGDGFSNLAERQAGTSPIDPASKPTGSLAWWRFEEATTGTVSAAANNVVLDSSGNAYHMRTYSDSTAPAYSTDVPFATIANGGQANHSSLYFDGGLDGSLLDLIYTEGNALRTMRFGSWTIEASFKLDAADRDQGIVTKDGNPISGQAPFHMKYHNPSGKVEIGIVDGSGVARYVYSNTIITAGQWYSVAATADATTLSIWVKGPGDSAYVLQNTQTISGAFRNNYSGLDDAWAAGRVRWNGGEQAYLKGNIDEIRISTGVLPSSAFLASSSSPDADNDGMTDAWETTNFGNTAQTATGDFDGDGTNNLTEFRLGLIPNSGTSRFAALRSSTGVLSWPSVTGVTFVVLRSEDLVTWTPVGTVPGTATTATFTDNAVPTGTKVFYKIALQP